MKYCLVKNSTTVIDGSENSDEIMYQNAIYAGYTENEVEIITEEEYKSRVENLPTPIPMLTLEERIEKLENLQLQQSGVI